MKPARNLGSSPEFREVIFDRILRVCPEIRYMFMNFHLYLGEWCSSIQGASYPAPG